MGFFSKKEPARYLTSKAYERARASQIAMSPQTVAQLFGIGVPPGTPLRLEYFFYTDRDEKGEALNLALLEKGYSSECVPAADGSPTYCITGWSTPVRVEVQDVVLWTDSMLSLGYEHDCEFDGWGTTPDQEGLPE
jgi:hypothetical protein